MALSVMDRRWLTEMAKFNKMENSLSSMLCIPLMAIAVSCIIPSSPALMTSSPNPTSTIVRSPNKFTLEGDDRYIFRAVHVYDVSIGVQLDGAGSVSQVDPLSGPSWYWPYALNAVRQPGMFLQNKSAQRIVVIFPDPTDRRRESSLTPCAESDNLNEDLKRGLLLLQSNERKKAEDCYRLVLRKRPDSIAANYGAAIAVRQLGRLKESIGFFQKALSIRPNFFEAKLDLAKTYSAIGSDDSAEKVARTLLELGTPLVFRKRASEWLLHFYDARNRRSEALESGIAAISAAAEIDSWDSSLINPQEVAFGWSDLGLRLEEVGRFEEAEHAYDQYFVWDAVSATPEASRFRADLGRIRALKRRRGSSSFDDSCERWRVRLKQLGNALDASSWGGKEVVRAEWEFTCGSRSKGLTVIKDFIRNRPGQDSPYRMLERHFRANQDPESALAAHLLAERVRQESDARVLRDIANQADVLLK